MNNYFKPEIELDIIDNNLRFTPTLKVNSRYSLYKIPDDYVIKTSKKKD